jgi:hypothetical protein
VIKIPEKEFDKLGTQGNYKLQFLITITADTGSFENDDYNPSDNTKNNQNNEAQYSIYYSNEPKRLNQNVPFDGFLSQGEFQYFNLYFDKSTENIYIGLTNMNGDADIYLNKGSELPTLEKYDWNSVNPTHEYIDINKNDKFFKDNKKSISGYYTLLLVGLVDTSFSLFVSNHKNKVFPLRDNLPIVCTCKKAGDKCLFRYSDVYDKNNVENGINHNEIIFTTQYLYGNGKMYAKLFKDSEIHGENFYKYFPTEKDYDISNKESNNRNYMKMIIEESKYSDDSAILMTFICEEKSQLDISATRLRHYSSVDYIQENKENVFYIGKAPDAQEQPELRLYFNNFFFNNDDFIYNVHSYVGDAHFKIYAND